MGERHRRHLGPADPWLMAKTFYSSYSVSDEAVGSISGWKYLQVTCKEGLETEQSMVRGCPAPTCAGQAAEEVTWGHLRFSVPASLPQVCQ